MAVGATVHLIHHTSFNAPHHDRLPKLNAISFTGSSGGVKRVLGNDAIVDNAVQREAFNDRELLRLKARSPGSTN